MFNKQKLILTIFYDSWCPICIRTKKIINFFDVFKFIHFYSLRDADLVSKYGLNISQLEKEMHSISSMNNKINAGFDTILQISLRIPVLFPFTVFLYILKITKTGSLTYRYIANKRKIIPGMVCDDSCRIEKR